MYADLLVPEDTPSIPFRVLVESTTLLELSKISFFVTVSFSWNNFFKVPIEDVYNFSNLSEYDVLIFFMIPTTIAYRFSLSSVDSFWSETFEN